MRVATADLEVADGCTPEWLRVCSTCAATAAGPTPPSCARSSSRAVTVSSPRRPGQSWKRSVRWSVGGCAACGRPGRALRWAGGGRGLPRSGGRACRWLHAGASPAAAVAGRVWCRASLVVGGLGPQRAAAWRLAGCGRASGAIPWRRHPGGMSCGRIARCSSAGSAPGRARWREPVILLGSGLWWRERWPARAGVGGVGGAGLSVPRPRGCCLERAVRRLGRFGTAAGRTPEETGRTPEETGRTPEETGRTPEERGAM